MAQSYQTQPYELISVHQDVEIRYYPPAMKVKVSVLYAITEIFNALFATYREIMILMKKLR